jgi:FMNH2-dependent dimethyl sulfone monooxygenase
MYGDRWLSHQDRYQRAGEFLEVVRGLWEQDRFSFAGQHYSISEATLRPRPEPPPIVFVSGESEAAIELAARAGDYLFVNGDDVDRVAALGDRVNSRARQHGRQVRLALSAFGLVRTRAAEAEGAVQRLLDDADLDTIRYFDQQMDTAVVAHTRGSDRDRIEANLGLRSGLTGEAGAVIERLRRFEAAGVDAVLLKFEGEEDEAERFAREVMAPFRR